MLALGCGLVASIGIHQWMTRRDGQTAPGETTTVFLATADIGLGESLLAASVKEEQWPKDKAPPGAISKIEDIEGRRTRTRLYAGEPILENKLFVKGDRDQGASALVPKGYRVVSVKVDLVSGGASLILPGDRVDVMVHLIKDCSRDIPETVTRTILQDIKVFAVNDVFGLENQKDGGKSIVAKTISLLVTPEQAAKVVLASQMGSVQLVMRGIEEEKQSPNAQAKPNELFGAVSKGEREKEEPADPAGAPERKNGFVDFLNAMKAKPAAEAATPAKARATWTMRVLTPPTHGQSDQKDQSRDAGQGQVKDVQFEADDDSPTAAWKVTGVTTLDGKDSASAKPQADDAALPPAAAKPTDARGEPKPTGKPDKA